MCLEQVRKITGKKALENKKKKIGYKYFRYKKLRWWNKKLQNYHIDEYAYINGKWNIDKCKGMLYIPFAYKKCKKYTKYKIGFHIWLLKPTRDDYYNFYYIAKVEYRNIVAEGYQGKPVIVCRKYRVLELYYNDKLVRKNK